MWSLFHLDVGLTTDQSFRRTYCYFSLLGYQKFLGFHSPWFQKFVCLEAKIGLCFLPKGWLCVFCLFFFLTHTYHLAVPFLLG